MVRTLGTTQIGLEHSVSTALAAATTLLPIGSRLQRAGLVNALATGVVCWLVYRLTLRIVGSGGATTTNAMLAAAAALLVGNCSPWQMQAAQLGGVGLASALGLGLIWASTARDRGQSPVLFGAMFGLLLVESASAAFCVGLSLLVHAGARGRLAPLAGVLTASLSALLCAAVVLLPSLLQVVRSGGDFRQLGLSVALPTSNASLSVASAFGELGAYLAALALLGAIVGLVRPLWRPPAAALVALGGGHLLMARASSAVLVTVAIAVFASLGLRAALSLGQSLRLPWWRTTRRVLVLFHLAALLMVTEGSREATNSLAVNATGIWSRQAYDRLPGRSLLLTNSPEAAWRLWAQRLTSGVRPDVLLVPQSLIGNRDLASELLAQEPALRFLIRDAALSGEGSEYALSHLADARPLRVEPDPKWGRRVLAHCEPDGLWFRFAPHELGRSDRRQAFRSVARATRKIGSVARTPTAQDQLTLERLHRDLEQQAAVSIALRDRDNARDTLRRLRRLGAKPEMIRRLEVALKERKSVAALGELLGPD